jgi:hypothetical protein|tara:strand:+ start:857 stop:1528 length:672 start_codon:yes stop_codon:yes gene_type:complete
MKKIIIKFISSILLINLIQLSSYGHSVYFDENKNSEIKIRFGEFQDEYEESPGYLDSLDTVSAWKINEKKEPEILETEKQMNGFSINAINSDNIAAQTGFPIMSRQDNARKPYFYARWCPNFKSKSTPSLTLDIVPNGKAGEVKVFFRGKTLSGIKLKLYSPDYDEVELVSDKNGLVVFKDTLKSKGIYMLKIARYSEKVSGYDQGKLYEIISHNCSLSWNQK